MIYFGVWGSDVDTEVGDWHDTYQNVLDSKAGKPRLQPWISASTDWLVSVGNEK